MSSNIEIEEIAYHRNGVGGVPFYVLTFRDMNEDGREMVGVVFPHDIDSEKDDEQWLPTDGRYRNPPTAVFGREMLGKGIIAFGENSFRGDQFDLVLRRAIVDHVGRP